MVLVEGGLGNPHRLVEVVIRQGWVENGVAVLVEIGRLHAAWCRIPAVKEKDEHGVLWRMDAMHLERPTLGPIANLWTRLSLSPADGTISRFSFHIRGLLVILATP